MDENFTGNSKNPSVGMLLKRLRAMRSEGKPIYFDVEEFSTLIDHFISVIDLKQADELIGYALAIHPNNTEILILKFHALVCEGKLAEARQLMQQIPDKQDYEYMLTEAELLLARGDREKGDAKLEQLYRQEPQMYTILDIAEVYICYGFQEKAKEWLTMAGTKDTDDLEVIQTYSKYYYAFGEYENAVSCLKKQIDGDPYDLEAWQLLIRCHLFLDNEEQAQADMEFALAIDENNPVNLELKGNLCLQREDYKGAVSYLKKAEERAVEKTSPRFTLMNLYAAMRMYDEVIAYGTTIVAENALCPKDLARVYQHRANAYVHKKDFGKAMLDVEKGLEYDSKNEDLYLLGGRICLHDKQTDKAEHYFNLAKEVSPDTVETLTDIGRFYASEGYYDEAIPLLNDLRDNFPDSDKLVLDYCLAFCYYKQNKEMEAMKLLIRSMVFVKFFPQDLGNLIPEEEEREFKAYISDKLGEGFEVCFPTMSLD